MEREAGLLSDVPSYHISTTEIAQLAADAGVGEVILTHVIPPIGNETSQEAAFTSGMGEVYTGPVRVARDLQRISIEKRGT